MMSYIRVYQGLIADPYHLAMTIGTVSSDSTFYLTKREALQLAKDLREMAKTLKSLPKSQEQ